MGIGLHVEGPVIKVKGHVVNFVPTSCIYSSCLCRELLPYIWMFSFSSRMAIFNKIKRKSKYLTWIFISCGRQFVNFNLLQLMCGSLCWSQSANALPPAPDVQYSIWLVCNWQKLKHMRKIKENQREQPETKKRSLTFNRFSCFVFFRRHLRLLKLVVYSA